MASKTFGKEILAVFQARTYILSTCQTRGVWYITQTATDAVVESFPIFSSVRSGTPELFSVIEEGGETVEKQATSMSFYVAHVGRTITYAWRKEPADDWTMSNAISWFRLMTRIWLQWKRMYGNSCTTFLRYSVVEALMIFYKNVLYNKNMLKRQKIAIKITRQKM